MTPSSALRNRWLFDLIRILLPILALLVAADACDPTCSKFTFCTLSGPNTFLSLRFRPAVLRAPKTASFPFVCGRDGRKTFHVRVQETGEALVSQLGLEHASPAPISDWKPVGLNSPSVPFPRNFFDIFDIPLPYRMQGVGRVESEGNQESLLNSLCVRIPIKSYTEVNEMGASIGDVVKSNEPESCISFRPLAPDLVADFYWQKQISSRIVEVKLFLTNKERQRLSIARELGNPSKCIGCQSIYLSKADPGVYRVGYSVSIRPFTVRHYSNGRSHDCPGPYALMKTGKLGDNIRVTANMKVTVRGKLVLNRVIRFNVREDNPKSGFFPGKVKVPGPKTSGQRQ